LASFASAAVPTRGRTTAPPRRNRWKSGSARPPSSSSEFDTKVDYEVFTEIDGLLGHGGIVVFAPA
jgi:hypothetical protein